MTTQSEFSVKPEDKNAFPVGIVKETTEIDAVVLFSAHTAGHTIFQIGKIRYSADAADQFLLGNIYWSGDEKLCMQEPDWCLKWFWEQRRIKSIVFLGI